MTDQEIDRWVEEHLSDINDPAIRNHCIRLGQIIAQKFYRKGKSEIPINLTWQDIATIDSLLTEVSNSYAVGNFDYDGERENFYKKVLDEYNRLHQTKA